LTELTGPPALGDSAVSGPPAPRGSASTSAVSAVVVNFNAAQHLAACLASLRGAGVGEVVVVDNASVDDSKQVVAAADPRARFLPAGANLGFGAGANVGLRATSAEAVVVCNPDLVVEPGTVAALMAALDADPRVGIVGPKILDRNGDLYPSARTFPALGDALGHAFLGLLWPTNRFSGRYKMLGWDHAAPAEVDWVSGAFFLARRTTLEALGGFDESYFMYSEDVDLCWRAARAGWTVRYEPSGVVTHVQGASTDLRPYRMIAAHHRSLMRFAARSTTGWRRSLLPLVGIGLALRAAMASAQRGIEGARARRKAGGRDGTTPGP
jgi:N-acetylglucosaminyl-diphospho-decaprenol L-rhamnosyltransferase